MFSATSIFIDHGLGRHAGNRLFGAAHSQMMNINSNDVAEFLHARCRYWATRNLADHSGFFGIAHCRIEATSFLKDYKRVRLAA